MIPRLYINIKIEEWRLYENIAIVSLFSVPYCTPFSVNRGRRSWLGASVGVPMIGRPTDGFFILLVTYYGLKKT